MRTRCSSGGTSIARELLGFANKHRPVTVTEEPNSVTLPGIAPATAASGSIHIELPGRAVISVEAGVDPELVRTVLGSLLR
jgi:hypothetical protein